MVSHLTDGEVDLEGWVRLWQNPGGIPNADISWLKEDTERGLTPVQTYKDIRGQIKRRRVMKSDHLNSAHTYTHHETVNQMEEAIAMTITSTINDHIANKCITTKIKDVLSGRGVALARVVGLGSDGANVMVGRKAGVAQKMRLNDCPYLINIHCGAH
ncbi:E3 SUMO-protein ligase KIAA1586 [Dissostichus eleginoides]|uniref:E3 SUMO-protein ligase KIAA1586 n=1 Tax=Dissostichus eleginoides TaxID=100907 RepID=A0AAD9B9N8_DISEL|nr:E3 SUMO-protein ligase KIAA1586 [Dissostichus eleginoides]